MMYVFNLDPDLCVLRMFVPRVLCVFASLFRACVCVFMCLCVLVCVCMCVCVCVCAFKTTSDAFAPCRKHTANKLTKLQ